MLSCAVPVTISAEGGNGVASEVVSKTEQAGTKVATVDRRVYAGNQRDVGE